MEERKKRRERRETGNYCFPEPVAKGMLKISHRTQMEASMMAMVVIMLGLIATAVYILFYMNVSIFFKVMTVINTLAGLTLLGSFLVGTFQQYRTLLLALGIINAERRIEIEVDGKEI